MKILLIICLCLFIGCEKKEETVDEPIIETPSEPVIVYKDLNETKVGLYTKVSHGRTLTKDITGSWGNDVVIGSFSVLMTDEDNIYDQSSLKVLFNKYKNDNVKIGYSLSYKVGEEEINHIMLDASNFYEHTSYMQVYLYDDINNSGYYSHLESSNENTVMTTIKLVTGWTFNKITSPIKVSVFTYDDMDDFDPDTKLYRGNSIYSFNIIKKD